MQPVCSFLFVGKLQVLYLLLLETVSAFWLRFLLSLQVIASMDPKPVPGDWSGNGAPVKYSTRETREEGKGWFVIQEHLKRLQHVRVLAGYLHAKFLPSSPNILPLCSLLQCTCADCIRSTTAQGLGMGSRTLPKFLCQLSEAFVVHMQTHMQHMVAYGVGNAKRWAGAGCRAQPSSSVLDFTVGMENRSASVRIPHSVLLQKRGWCVSSHECFCLACLHPCACHATQATWFYRPFG